MTLQSSGAISLDDIRKEYGISGAVSLNDANINEENADINFDSLAEAALDDYYGAKEAMFKSEFYTNIDLLFCGITEGTNGDLFGVIRGRPSGLIYYSYFWVYRVDRHKGTLEWIKKVTIDDAVADVGDVHPTFIHVDGDYVYIGGQWKSDGDDTAEYMSAFIVQLDTDGSFGWSKAFTDTDTKFKSATVPASKRIKVTSMATDSSGNLYATLTNSNSGVQLAKLTTAGALSWCKHVGDGDSSGTSYGDTSTCVVTSSDKIIVGGGVLGFAEYNTSGTQTAAYRHGINVSEKYSLTTDSSGNVYISLTNGKTRKYNSSYTSQWRLSLGNIQNKDKDGNNFTTTNWEHVSPSVSNGNQVFVVGQLANPGYISTFDNEDYYRYDIIVGVVDSSDGSLDKCYMIGTNNVDDSGGLDSSVNPSIMAQDDYCILGYTERKNTRVVRLCKLEADGTTTKGSYDPTDDTDPLVIDEIPLDRITTTVGTNLTVTSATTLDDDIAGAAVSNLDTTVEDGTTSMNYSVETFASD